MWCCGTLASGNCLQSIGPRQRPLGWFQLCGQQGATRACQRFQVPKLPWVSPFYLSFLSPSLRNHSRKEEIEIRGTEGRRAIKSPKRRFPALEPNLEPAKLLISCTSDFPNPLATALSPFPRPHRLGKVSERKSLFSRSSLAPNFPQTHKNPKAAGRPSAHLSASIFPPNTPSIDAGKVQNCPVPRRPTPT